MQTKTNENIPNLWPNGPDLRLVNKDSFNPKETMMKLDWSGFNAITDGDAIRKRQDTLKILMNSTDLCSFVNKTRSPGYIAIGREFFNYYGSKSPFMDQTKSLIETLSSAIDSSKEKLSTTLYPEILASLKEKFEEAYQAEDFVIETISPEIGKIYSYGGTVTITSGTKRYDDNYENFTNIKTNGYGSRNYAFHETNDGFAKFSRWIIGVYEKPVPKKVGKLLMYSILWIVGLIPRILSSIALSFIEKHRNDMLYTNEVPDTVVREINSIHTKFAETIHSRLNLSLSKFGVDIDDTKKVIQVKTEFQFSLNPEHGFTVRLIDATIDINHRSFRKAIEKVQFYNQVQNNNDVFLEGIVFEKGVSFYSKFKRKLFEYKARNLAIESAKKALQLPMRAALEYALIESKELLGGGIDTMSEKMYEDLLTEVKYRNVQNTIAGMGLQDEWNISLQFRKEIESLTTNLRKHAHTCETVMKSIEAHKDLPWCFPTVLENDKNMVVFNNLAPLHLIGRKNPAGNEIKSKDLRLIAGLPALNGRIISITGKNGGGKTATEVEMINALYQAHTGLPVFAKEFSFNAKDAIAMVFVERGEGSMLQLLMKKLATIAEEVNNNPVNKIVIVIDELLTGTQEDTGLDIGKKYLNMLAKKGCSVMFVTQITSLAEYSQNELGALCYYFDKNGKLQPGIGKGNAYMLAEQVGLTKYLEEV